MNLHTVKTVELKDFTTLGITATVDYMIHITKLSELTAAVNFAQEKNLPIFPLGGGSNIVLGQARLECVALKLEIPGRDILTQAADYTDVRVGAGENWDDFVAWSVKNKLRGIEALSLIPGTVGAAPVQNIGAYGQELHETVLSVTAYDISTGNFVELSNSDCEFKYRDSMLKHSGKGKYIVTAVTFRLLTDTGGVTPSYAGLQAELGRRGITKPTVEDTRKAVIDIRRAKLPDPEKIPTAGSFFHNPIISADDFHHLEIDFPTIPHWPTADGRVKLAGAWLVEQCGFKGVIDNGVGIYDKQALALINPGHRPASEVLAFRDRIITEVQKRFGVKLNMEPELIKF